MSRIFISHSSRNNAEALALRDWLDANGWSREDIFLDLDPVRGLVAGDRWQARLKEAANRCEAVLLVITPDWAASRWCGAEFLLAKTLGKKIFGITVVPTPFELLPVELTGEFQVVNLAMAGDVTHFEVKVPPDNTLRTVSFHTGELAGLKAGLERAGLNARSFRFDPERPIFRGLRALEEKDASIFFGRDTKIIEGLDGLRSLTGKGGSQFFVILGASGSGKSSFLRAGLYPRLERDDRKFLPLPVVRPGRQALSGELGLLASLHQAAKALECKALSRAALEGQIQQPDGLMTILKELQVSARARLHYDAAKSPLIVLPIDQGEELFEADAGSEAGRLLDLICPLTKSGELLVLLCMRSDGFERLQQAPQLQKNGVDVTVFSLPPMPPHAFKQIVEGPIERLRAAMGEGAIEFDPKLTDRLLNDIGTTNADALPLLAFVLERQLRRFDRLTLQDYEVSEGLKGAIVDAAAEAFRNPKAEPAIPEDAETRTRLLRKAFIPYLARIDEATGETRRRVAKLSEIPSEAHPLIERLVQVRLLVRHQPLKEGKSDPYQPIQIEPAHEALLRQWPELVNWLTEEKANLLTLETALRSAKEWDDNGRSPDYIAHKGGRLQDSVELARREDYKAKLRGIPQDYLSAAQKAEDAQRQAEREQIEREKRQLEEVAAAQKLAKDLLIQREDAFKDKETARKRQLRALRVVVVIGVMATVAISSLAWNNRAAENAALTAQSKFLASEARKQTAAGNAEVGLLLSLTAIPQNDPPERPIERDAIGALIEARYALRVRSVINVSDASEGGALLSEDGSRFMRSHTDGLVRIFDTLSGKTIHEFKTDPSTMKAANISSDLMRIAVATKDNIAEVWSGKVHQKVKLGGKNPPGVSGIAVSPDGKKIVTESAGQNVRISVVGENLLTIDLEHSELIADMMWSPLGDRLVIDTFDGEPSLFNASTGQLIGNLDQPSEQAPFSQGALQFSPSGELLVTKSEEFEVDGRNHITIWDAQAGKRIRKLGFHKATINSARFTTSGDRLVTTSDDQTVRLWDVATGDELAVLSGHSAPVRTGKFSISGRLLVSASDDGSVRIWDVDPESQLPIGEREVLVLRGHVGRVTNAAVLPDERHIASVSENDLSVRLWDLDAEGETKRRDGCRNVYLSSDASRTVCMNWNDSIAFHLKHRA